MLNNFVKEHFKNNSFTKKKKNSNNKNGRDVGFLSVFLVLIYLYCCEKCIKDTIIFLFLKILNYI